MLFTILYIKTNVKDLCSFLQTTMTATLRLSLTQLENAVPGPFLHPNWSLHRQNWLKAVHLCSKPHGFALILLTLESCIKPVLFNHVWHDSLGEFVCVLVCCLTYRALHRMSLLFSGAKTIKKTKNSTQNNLKLNMLEHMKLCHF